MPDLDGLTGGFCEQTVCEGQAAGGAEGGL